MLLEASGDPNMRFGGQTPLMLAARHGHAGCVGMLLEAKGDPAMMDLKQRTSVHLAAEAGHAVCDTSTAARLMRGVQAVCTLLAASTDPVTLQAEDVNKVTASDVAAANGHRHVRCIS